jgi:hypothetical protein
MAQHLFPLCCHLLPLLTRQCQLLGLPHDCPLVDECYLVLFYTPLFTFVRPLALLIFNYLTCFVCFCNKQAFTSRLDQGRKNGHEMMKKNPEVRSNA